MALLAEARRRSEDELRRRMRAEAAQAAAETAAAALEDRLRALRLEVTHVRGPRHLCYGFRSGHAKQRCWPALLLPRMSSIALVVRSVE
jgi:hypothetical protein